MKRSAGQTGKKILILLVVFLLIDVSFAAESSQFFNVCTLINGAAACALCVCARVTEQGQKRSS